MPETRVNVRQTGDHEKQGISCLFSFYQMVSCDFNTSQTLPDKIQKIQFVSPNKRHGNLKSGAKKRTP